MMRYILALVLPGLLTVNAVAAELVVIESTSPEYRVGDIVEEGSDIVIGEGTQISLIAEDGMVISLQGPHSGPPALEATPAGSSVLDALGQLLGDAETAAEDIGGLRGDDSDDDYFRRAVDDHRTSPWMLHTAITGPQCVRENSGGLEFWREQNDNSERLLTKIVSSGETATVSWRAGDNTVAWPATLPVIAGEMYLLRSGDELRSTNLLLRAVPEAVADDSIQMVAFLAANGCIPQARMELARLRQVP